MRCACVVRHVCLVTVRNVQREACVCVHVCMVCCTFVNVRDCDCVIVSIVRARAMSGTCAYTYLTRVSKKTNTLDKRYRSV